MKNGQAKEKMMGRATSEEGLGERSPHGGLSVLEIGESGMGREMGGRVKRDGIYIYIPMADSC